MANELAIPSLVTEQYVQGLGRTVPIVSQAMANPAARLEKTRFSAAVEMVVDQFRQWRRSTILVAGIEAHVCVLQSVLDLQASGFQCFVCTDAISAGQRDQIAPALQRMGAAGALPTGVMSAMYELMADARHPSFRACLELAKKIVP
jgi:isochorismate hydrolase